MERGKASLAHICQMLSKCCLLINWLTIFYFWNLVNNNVSALINFFSRVRLYIPDWPGFYSSGCPCNLNPSASASWVLGSRDAPPMPGYICFSWVISKYSTVILSFTWKHIHTYIYTYVYVCIYTYRCIYIFFAGRQRHYLVVWVCDARACIFMHVCNLHACMGFRAGL